MSSYINFLSFLVGVLGFIIAIYQTFRMKKLRKVHEEKCSTRFKDVTNLVTSLVENVSRACVIVRSKCISEKKHPFSPQCIKLSAKIDSAMELTKQLIRFCERLNEEHKYEFGHLVDEDLAKKVNSMNCMLCVETFDDLKSHSMQESE